MRIAFNQPVVLESTLGSIQEALALKPSSGAGSFTKRCEDQLQKQTGSRNLLVTSATHALEMMGLLLDIKSGDEVIIPSFTFVSTANAFVLRGAKIRFADNDEYGNIKISEVERLLTPKTRAVMAVHYAGNSADMQKLAQVCASANVALVEDAAQSIGSTCRGKHLGTFGALGCFSFHETKNVTSGEGGSLILGDPKFGDRAEIIREKGTNRRQFIQGLADKYTWVDLGSSYVLAELNASYLYSQLMELEKINARRKKIWKRYSEALAEPLKKVGARQLETPAYNDSPNGHLFAILWSSQSARDAFIAHMSKLSITCPFHYVPLHTSPYGKKVAVDPGEVLKQCDQFSGSLVRLPLFYSMTDEQQNRVIDETLKWIAQK